MATYNPEWKPNGIEGGMDTNKLPWIPLPQAPGMSIKPLRASTETGFFTIVVRLAQGTKQPNTVYLGAADFIVLSGGMAYPDGPLQGAAETGTWGYIPAGARVNGLTSSSGCEYLGNFYGPLAFLAGDGTSVGSLLTALDIRAAAERRGITLAPSTLADAMGPRPAEYKGPAEPLAISKGDGAALCTRAEGIAATAKVTSPHFVDSRRVPWIVNEAMPDVGLKILRVSAETGVISMIVRHNGAAPPHYHLGPADFMVLAGKIGYRAGPPEGYGPGMWFFEPAGARHESTQRIGTEDLIYTANVYGPIQFDEGVGTPITMVLSWMQYLAQAQEAKAPLVKSTFDGDKSLLAWAPLGGAPAKL